MCDVVPKRAVVLVAVVSALRSHAGRLGLRSEARLLMCIRRKMLGI